MKKMNMNNNFKMMTRIINLMNKKVNNYLIKKINFC
jgi:hypothetical protein